MTTVDIVIAQVLYVAKKLCNDNITIRTLSLRVKKELQNKDLISLNKKIKEALFCIKSKKKIVTFYRSNDKIVL